MNKVCQFTSARLRWLGLRRVGGQFACGGRGIFGGFGGSGFTLNTQIETLEGLGMDIARISQETKLGMTAGGQAMSKFNREVATLGAKAFVPAHQQFVQTLTTTVQAIQIAMDNYAKTDSDNAGELKAKD